MVLPLVEQHTIHQSGVDVSVFFRQREHSCFCSSRGDRGDEQCLALSTGKLRTDRMSSGYKFTSCMLVSYDPINSMCICTICIWPRLLIQGYPRCIAALPARFFLISFVIALLSQKGCATSRPLSSSDLDWNRLCRGAWPSQCARC